MRLLARRRERRRRRRRRRRRSHHLVEERVCVFVSLSLSVSDILFCVQFVPEKRKETLAQKQTIWTLSRDDGSSSACVLFVRDDSFPAKRAEERENSKNLKKTTTRSTQRGKKEETFLIKISLCKRQ